MNKHFFFFFGWVGRVVRLQASDGTNPWALWNRGASFTNPPEYHCNGLLFPPSWFFFSSSFSWIACFCNRMFRNWIHDNLQSSDLQKITIKEVRNEDVMCKRKLQGANVSETFNMFKYWIIRMWARYSFFYLSLIQFLQKK